MKVKGRLVRRETVLSTRILSRPPILVKVDGLPTLNDALS